MPRGLHALSTALLLLGCEREPPPPTPADGLPSVPRPRVVAIDPGEAFDEDFRRAGRPRAPVGWRPVAREQVLAHFVDTSWYLATVLEVHPEKGKVRLRWRAGTGEDRDVALSEIVPLPAANRLPRALPPDVPAFALLRPASEAERWLPVRLIAIDEEGIEVRDRDGRRRRAAASDLLLVGH